MAKKIKSFKKLLNYYDCYSDILDIISQDDDISDEDIAHYANIDIDTVKSIKKKWANESLWNS
ncbi:MAG TPA: hypothetical protein GX514_03960 [Thermoanaerobacterales bacterium]|uniref:hypothetical protein n=1 Tax=Tepidanaerobacter sp. GT38 TaxID=2722793 RepID=UPI0017C2EDEB|nr:hypothetical protein [Tepidanaerobacter sp. GT38]MCG1012924.1 hypothetical protein [Tepidanaerobacter sp. GT38]HHY41988.1 hypothetical protein [Thermoanaerobacterales bacterium]